MAGWQETLVTNDTFRVNVSSRSWWRWRWAKLRHIPYFVGDHPRFAFTVQVERNVGTQRAYWALYSAGNELENGFLVGSGAHAAVNVTEPGSAQVDITMPMLATSGEYTIVLGAGQTGDPPEGRRPNSLVVGDVVYSFSVVTREGLFIKVGIPVGFALGSGIIAIWNLVLNIARGS